MKNSGHKDAMETRLLACHRGLAKNSKWTLPRGFGFELQKCLLALGKLNLSLIEIQIANPLSFGQKIEMPGMAYNLFSSAQNFLLEYITIIYCMYASLNTKNVKFRKGNFSLKVKTLWECHKIWKKNLFWRLNRIVKKTEIFFQSFVAFFKRQLWILLISQIVSNV